MKDFKPLAEIVKNQSGRRIVSRNKVIKSPNVNDDHRITIKPPVDFDGNSDAEVQPIMENGEIVGIMYRCSCGRISEIRFEYESHQSA